SLITSQISATKTGVEGIIIADIDPVIEDFGETQTENEMKSNRCPCMECIVFGCVSTVESYYLNESWLLPLWRSSISMNHLAWGSCSVDYFEELEQIGEGTYEDVFNNDLCGTISMMGHLEALLLK
ncbi:hypothetical protein IFM89_001092, partial [Coptis chinensis]